MPPGFSSRFTRLLHRALPYLDHTNDPSAWRTGPEGEGLAAWADAIDAEITVEYRVSGAWLNSAPEYGPGWLATIRPRAGGRKSRGMGATQVEAVVAARREHGRRSETGKVPKRPST